MSNFAVGDGVTVVDGPMAGVYGTVVWFYEKRGEFLVRFGATQQLYYAPEQIVAWADRP